MFRKVNDFDGDGKADFAVTRNQNGSKTWYVYQSTGGFRAFQWGIGSDKEAAGDFDGDGKTDAAVNRIVTPNNYQLFFAQRSATNDYFTRQFYSAQGVIFNESAQQDYDGDGKTDIAYFFRYNNVSCCRSLNVFESSRTTGGDVAYYQTNVDASLLRLGDITGDGKSDVVSLNAANNILTIENYSTRTSSTVQFGIAGDQFVPADFDGDGKGDIAVFRESNGTWWWKRSSDNAVQAAQFGQAGDKPVPADYDGDGKTDLAIWRSGQQSVFWVNGSQTGVFALPWGIAGDSVVTY